MINTFRVIMRLKGMRQSTIPHRLSYQQGGCCTQHVSSEFKSPNKPSMFLPNICGIGIMKTMFIQWWAAIPPISTTWIITSHLPQLIERKNRPRHMMLEIQFLVWDRHSNVGVLKWLMESQSFPLNNWIANGNTYIISKLCAFWIISTLYL